MKHLLSNIIIYIASLGIVFLALSIFFHHKHQQKISFKQIEKTQLLATFEVEKSKIFQLYQDRNALLLGELARLNSIQIQALKASVNQIIENMDHNQLISTSDWTRFESEIEKTHQVVAQLRSFIAQNSPFWKNLLKIESQIEYERKAFLLTGNSLKALSSSQKIAGFQADLNLLERN